MAVGIKSNVPARSLNPVALPKSPTGSPLQHRSSLTDPDAARTAPRDRSSKAVPKLTGRLSVVTGERRVSRDRPVAQLDLDAHSPSPAAGGSTAAARLLSKLGAFRSGEEVRAATSFQETQRQTGQLLNALLRDPGAPDFGNDGLEVMQLCGGLRSTMGPFIARPELAASVRSAEENKAYESTLARMVQTHVSTMNERQLRTIANRLPTLNAGQNDWQAHAEVIAEAVDQRLTMHRAFEQDVRNVELALDRKADLFTATKEAAASFRALTAKCDSPATAKAQVGPSFDLVRDAVVELMNDQGALSQADLQKLNGFARDFGIKFWSADANHAAAASSASPQKHAPSLASALKNLGSKALAWLDSVRTYSDRAARRELEQQTARAVKNVRVQLSALTIVKPKHDTAHLVSATLTAMPHAMRHLDSREEKLAAFREIVGKELDHSPRIRLVALKQRLDSVEAMADPLPRAGKKPLSSAEREVRRSFEGVLRQELAVRLASAQDTATELRRNAELRAKLDIPRGSLDAKGAAVTQAGPVTTTERVRVSRELEHPAVFLGMAARELMKGDLNTALLEMKLAFSAMEPFLKGLPLEDQAPLQVQWVKEAVDQLKLSAAETQKLQVALEGEAVANLCTVLATLPTIVLGTGEDPNRASLSGEIGRLPPLFAAFAEAIQPPIGSTPEPELEPGIVDQAQLHQLRQAREAADKKLLEDMEGSKFAPAYEAIDKAFNIQVGVVMDEHGSRTRFVPVLGYEARTSNEEAIFDGSNQALARDVRAAARAEGNLSPFYILDALAPYVPEARYTVSHARSFIRQLEKDAADASAEVSPERDALFNETKRALMTSRSKEEAQSAIDSLRAGAQQIIVRNTGRLLRLDGVPI